MSNRDPCPIPPFSLVHSRSSKPDRPNQLANQTYQELNRPPWICFYQFSVFRPPDVHARSDCVILRRLLGGGLRGEVARFLGLLISLKQTTPGSRMPLACIDLSEWFPWIVREGRAWAVTTVENIYYQEACEYILLWNWPTKEANIRKDIWSCIVL